MALPIRIYEGADAGVGVGEGREVRWACAVGREERPVRAVLSPTDEYALRIVVRDLMGGKEPVSSQSIDLKLSKEWNGSAVP